MSHETACQPKDGRGMLTLYQFPISHYCEKVRWALEYKHIDYRAVNLLPGFHVSKTTQLARHSFVPILQAADQVIQGSSEIITYLDAQYPEPGLTPPGPQAEEALNWERYVDDELGPHVRRCCYQILLDYPDIVIGLFTHRGPFYAKPLLKLIFPKLKTKMKALMDINAETALQSERQIDRVVNRLIDRLQTRSYLAGSQFTRADLAAAALIAPLRMPEKYGVTWPEKVPAQFLQFMDKFSSRTDWVDELYRQYR
ncbi:MAG: glutathione S-transferase family protein [Candidatus Thiodiazotropha sp.]